MVGGNLCKYLKWNKLKDVKFLLGYWFNGINLWDIYFMDIKF